jgi:hypothetical protein
MPNSAGEKTSVANLLGVSESVNEHKTLCEGYKVNETSRPLLFSV